jgi:hypothetical protein
MINTPHPHRLRKAPLFTPYVVVWTMVGALSLGFLMVLGIAPEWLDDLKPASTFAFQQNAQGQRAAARLNADLGQLKDSVAQIQLDLSKVRTDVELQGEQQKAVTAQIASLETRISVALPPSALETAMPADPEAAPTSKAGASEASKPPARTPNVINAETAVQSSALETGSVSGQSAKAGTRALSAADETPAVTTINAATEAISFGPAVVKSAPQPVGLKLSTGASVDSLRLSWSLLSEKHGDALNRLEARYTSGGDEFNPTYDLVAGPIKSKAEAVKICKALTAKGVACTVGTFAGDAL